MVTKRSTAFLPTTPDPCCAVVAPRRAAVVQGRFADVAVHVVSGLGSAAWAVWYRVCFIQAVQMLQRAQTTLRDALASNLRTF